MAVRGGLARALKADHEDRNRGGGFKVDAFAGGTQHLDQMVVDDLDDHLTGRDRPQDFLPDRLFLDAGDELLDHGQGHVRLKQGDTHLAQGGADVFLAQRATPCQAIEDVAQPSGQPFKHASLDQGSKIRTTPFPCAAMRPNENAPVRETRGPAGTLRRIDCSWD